MRTYAPKPKATPHADRIASGSHAGQNRPASEHPAPRQNAHRAERGPRAADNTRSAYDFSRIPIYARTAFSNRSKLAISTPHDAHEQEADRVAEQIVHDSAPSRGGLREQPHAESAADSSTDLTAAPPSVRSALNSPGERMDAATRAYMEPRFGRDFSAVHLHYDANSQRSAQDVNARAYTLGHHIVFGSGQPSPHLPEGRKLLAHELTHVVQQRAGAPMLQRQADQAEPQAVDKGLGINFVCKTHPYKVKQEGPTCWAAALYSIKYNVDFLSTPSDGHKGYVEKYKDYVDDQGSLIPGFWSTVAKSEGMQFTQEKNGDEITPAFLFSALGGWAGGGYCQPLWVAEQGSPYAHAYVIFGIEGYNMVRMDPGYGGYNVIDVRKISSGKKFKISSN